jgi:hypothetical protein
MRTRELAHGSFPPRAALEPAMDSFSFSFVKDLTYDHVLSGHAHTAPQDLEADDELDLAFSTTSLNELSLDPVTSDGAVTVVPYAEVSFQDLVSSSLHPL